MSVGPLDSFGEADGPDGLLTPTVKVAESTPPSASAIWYSIDASPVKVDKGVNVISPLVGWRLNVPLPAITTELAVQFGGTSPEAQSFKVEAESDQHSRATVFAQNGRCTPGLLIAGEEPQQPRDHQAEPD